MNYCKKSNQEKFIKYWNNEILKKLIRCSKEFGFHRNLKATLGAEGSTKRDEFVDFILKHIIKDIEKNKRYIISFYEVLHDDKLQYPLCAAKYSKVHLAHLFTLEVLNHCKNGENENKLKEEINKVQNELKNIRDENNKLKQEKNDAKASTNKTEYIFVLNY